MSKIRVLFIVGVFMFFAFVLSLVTFSSLLACTCCPKQDTTIVHKDIGIENPYFSALKGAKNAAAYLTIKGNDKLLKATYFGSDIQIVELHTHILNDKGIAKMRSVESFEINGEKVFKPGEDHIMLIDVSKDLSNKDHIDLILHFEKAGKVKVHFHKKDTQKSCCGS